MGHKRAAGGRWRSLANTGRSLACKTKVQGKVFSAKCMSSRSLSCGASGSSRRCVFELHFSCWEPMGGRIWGVRKGAFICLQNQGAGERLGRQKHKHAALTLQMYRSTDVCLTLCGCEASALSSSWSRAGSRVRALGIKACYFATKLNIAPHIPTLLHTCSSASSVARRSSMLVCMSKRPASSTPQDRAEDE